MTRGITIEKRDKIIADHSLPREALYPGELLLCADPPFGCGEMRPLEEFSDSKRNICNACWASKGMAVLAHRKEVKARQLMDQIAHYSGRRRKHKRPPHIFESTAELMEQIGGVNGFAERYAGVLDEAINEGRLAHAAKLLHGIAWMLSECSKIEEHQEDVLAMNAEQLAEEKLSVIAEVLAQNGLKIMPADEDDESEASASTQECA